MGSEYLTPEEVEQVAEWSCHGRFALPIGRCGIDYAATLRSYAQVVEAVAQCSLIKDDLSVDTIILARELRGHADQRGGGVRPSHANTPNRAPDPPRTR